MKNTLNLVGILTKKFRAEKLNTLVDKVVFDYKEEFHQLYPGKVLKITPTEDNKYGEKCFIVSIDGGEANMCLPDMCFAISMWKNRKVGKYAR